MGNRITLSPETVHESDISVCERLSHRSFHFHSGPEQVLTVPLITGFTE